MLFNLFSGAKARRLKMDNEVGEAGIPALTPVAEHLATLKTLKEVREEWKANKTKITAPTLPPSAGLFSSSTITSLFPSVPVRVKRPRSHTPAM